MDIYVVFTVDNDGEYFDRAFTTKYRAHDYVLMQDDIMKRIVQCHELDDGAQLSLCECS